MCTPKQVSRGCPGTPPTLGLPCGMPPAAEPVLFHFHLCMKSSCWRWAEGAQSPSRLLPRRLSGGWGALPELLRQLAGLSPQSRTWGWGATGGDHSPTGTVSSLRLLPNPDSWLTVPIRLWAGTEGAQLTSAKFPWLVGPRAPRPQGGEGARGVSGHLAKAIPTPSALAPAGHTHPPHAAGRAGRAGCRGHSS